jgi:flavin-dependent dehydrogenase
VVREHFPDVLDDLKAAGAEQMTLTRSLNEFEPGDEDLNTLIVRRTTLEWVLREAVRHESGVRYRPEVSVERLIVGDRPGRAGAGAGAGAGADVIAVPHVVGAHLSDGSEVRGDVIACTGRRGAVPAWLSDIGVELTENVVDTEIIYLTRWYRRSGDIDIEIDPRLGGDFGYLKYLAIPCDGSTFSVTLAVRSKDTELRSRLLDPEAFDRACRILPGPDRFFAAGPVEPIGAVRPMGGLINRLRHFTDRSGHPLVTGFHAVGDAHTCTNPMYGRGCALAFVQATLLGQAYAAEPDDAAARPALYERLSAREVEPWYHSAVMMDSYGEGGGADGNAGSGAPKAPDPFMRKFGALVADVMLGRATDPILARGLLRMINTLVRPDELMADTEFLGRIASFFAEPDRDDSELLALRVSRRTLLQEVAA